jgi:hypothetical protein
VFTTVAKERLQPPERPYHTAGGTDVDLAILDEECMAYLCHFAMVHTATSLAFAQHGQPTKKQYGLKTSLKRFGSRGNTAVTKELSQLHTLNCFRPCDPSSLTRDDRRNALSSLMFLTEKCSGEVKVQMLVYNANMWLKMQLRPRWSRRKLFLFKAQYMLMNLVTLPHATSQVLSYKLTTLILFLCDSMVYSLS